MLSDRGRIALLQPLAVWRRRILAQAGIIEAPLDGDIALEAVQLPGTLHGDPADRMIVATARIHGWRLATRDRRLLAYAADGHLEAVSL